MLFAGTSAARCDDRLPVAQQRHLRRPVATVLSADEDWLYVANRRSGSITVIDLETRKVAAEYEIGKQLSDMVMLANDRTLLVTDEARAKLILLDASESVVKVQREISVQPFPVNIAAAKDGTRCYVTSLWPKQLNVLDLENGTRRVLDLPFQSECQLLVRDDQQLIVADSFGGRLAVIDTDELKLKHTVAFPAHNIRGLGLNTDGTMLIVTHQMLNELAHSVRNDVHWGLLMSNDLRWLRLDSVLSGATDLYAGAHMHPLGEAGSATADPSGMIMTSQGTVVVGLSGVDEIAFGKEDDFSMQRRKVGKRPTAVVASRDGRWVYVANTFDDSISIVDMGSTKRVADISLGPMPKLTLADRGELLFHDGHLSHDNWMSCQSCHTRGHTNGLMNDNFSDQSFGAPKRVLSLLEKTDTAPFAWNAATDSLRQQIRNSIEKTMQNEEPATADQVEAINAYVHTLKLPPPIDELRDTVDTDAIARGGQLFVKLECNKCHAPPAYTSPGVYDVGLSDKLGRNKFNPPSLRGVGHRGPYFHDSSAATLRDVFAGHGHQIDRDLSEDELRDLTAFLRSL